MPQQFWLMKSEPEVFGLDTLAAQPAQTTAWDGVRNFGGSSAAWGFSIKKLYLYKA